MLNTEVAPAGNILVLHHLDSLTLLSLVGKDFGDDVTMKESRNDVKEDKVKRGACHESS